MSHVFGSKGFDILDSGCLEIGALKRSPKVKKSHCLELIQGDEMI